MPTPRPRQPPDLDVGAMFLACFIIGGSLGVALYFWPGGDGPPARRPRRVR